MDKKYVNLEEAAEILGMSVDEVQQLRESGTLRGFADRGSWKFRSEVIEEMRRSRGGDSDPDVPILDESGPGASDLFRAAVSKEPAEDSSATDEFPGIPAAGENEPMSLSTEGSGIFDRSADDGGIELDDDSTGSSLLLEGEADSGIALDVGSDSGIALDMGSESGIALDVGSDSGIALDVGSDSGIAIDEQGAVADGPEPPGTERLPRPEVASDAELETIGGSALEDDFGFDEGDSGIALDVGEDSGIALDIGGDSGIALDIGGDSGIALDTGDSGIALEGIGSDVEPGTQQGTQRMAQPGGAAEPGFSDEVDATGRLASPFEMDDEELGDSDHVLSMGDEVDDPAAATAAFTEDQLSDFEDEFGTDDESVDEATSQVVDLATQHEIELGSEDEDEELFDEDDGEFADADDDLFGDEDDEEPLLGSEEEVDEVRGSAPPAPSLPSWGVDALAGLALTAVLMAATALVTWQSMREMWGTNVTETPLDSVVDAVTSAIP